MAQRTLLARLGSKHLGSIVLAFSFTVIAILLMGWLFGMFHRKVDADAALVSPWPEVGETKLVTVQWRAMPRMETAVGTISPVQESVVASQLLERVAQVEVTAGQMVQKGDVLVRLDDRNTRAALQQAQAGEEAAQARAEQARVELERMRELLEERAATPIEVDRARTTFEATHAELRRAQQGRKQMAVALDHTTIRAPMDGVIIDKSVDVGDTVTPGQPLLKLYDPGRMQLVANVRESLAYRLEVGGLIEVVVDALDLVCDGEISEIVPEAEAASRTFQVKVTGPCPPGVYSGMFGRLRIPLDDEEVLVIPASAVRHVGQLDMVEVEHEGFLKRRIVILGRYFGEEVEVLSGLRDGDRVARQAEGTHGEMDQ